MKGASIESCEVTEYHMYLKVINKRMKESKFMLTVAKMREFMNIPLEHDPIKEVELLADKFQLNLQ